MSPLIKRSAYFKVVSFIIGLHTVFTGIQFAAAEVTLTAPTVSVVENNSLTVTCTYTGASSVQAFYMLLHKEVEGSWRHNCSVFLKQPDETLYEYNCTSGRQINWTIKQVTRANDGDTWECVVYTSDGIKKATHIISLYDTNAKTSNTKVMVGVILGSFSFVIIVCATVATILLKRKTTNSDTNPSNQSTSQTTYGNEEQRGIALRSIEDLEASKEESENLYTSIDENDVYEDIETP